MKSKTATVTIESLNHEGRGVATYKQKKMFVRGALPNETVTVQINKSHSKYIEAVATDIIEPSPNRIAAKCSHFGVCGGCLLQHMSPQDQLQHKQQVLQDQLLHFGQTTASTWLPPLKGPIWQYRHKARLGVKFVAAKEKVVIGFREINGRFITDCQSCEILPAIIGKNLDALASLIQKLSIYNAIPQLEVALGDSAAAIIVRHLQPLTASDINLLQEFAEQQKIEIYLQPKGPDSITKCWPEDNNHHLVYQNPEYGVNFQFHPADFTQINPEINLAMVKQAINLLDLNNEDTVLDLFCGLGNFSLPLATIAKHVVGIEGDRNMVERAKQNSSHNQINNTEFMVSDLFQFDSQCPWVKSYSKLLLDPPRSGAEAIVSNIKHLGKPDIVYVSCNPATLARDAGILIQQGYQLAEAGIMDMFPHTGHVESMARFYCE